MSVDSYISGNIEYILLRKNIYNLLNLLLLYLIWHLLPICWCPYVCVIDQCACLLWKEEEGWPTKSIRNEYDTIPVCFNAFLSVQKHSPFHQGLWACCIFPELHSHPERGVEVPRNLPCQGWLGKYLGFCLPLPVNFLFVAFFCLFVWGLFCLFFFNRLSRMGGGLPQAQASALSTQVRQVRFAGSR